MVGLFKVSLLISSPLRLELRSFYELSPDAIGQIVQSSVCCFYDRCQCLVRLDQLICPITKPNLNHMGGAHLIFGHWQ